MFIDTKFNIGDYVTTRDNRKGIVKSLLVKDFDKSYLVKYLDSQEEIWYLEHYLNILVGEMYLVEGRNDI